MKSETHPLDVDVLIIGAGAAGMMAAIAAGNSGKARVLLLDSQRKIGAKILVAGGGRCNVTNEFVDASRFNTSPQDVPIAKSFVARVLRSYTVEATHRFFDSVGVPLKLEPTGKYFPVSDSARDVLNALLSAVRDAGAELRTESIVTALEAEPDAAALQSLWRVRTENGELLAKTVIIATGGLALPKSGSNGAGYEFARRLGHTIVATTPALSPLIANPASHAGLSGITLPARLYLQDGKEALADYTGSFLFTHTGYSGPPALDISRHFARVQAARPAAAIYLRLLPEVEDGEEKRYWHAFIGREAKKSVSNALATILPRRVAEAVAKSAGAPGETALGKLSPAVSARLQTELFAARLPVVGVGPYHKAEATAGGVSLAEIEPATMMSRLCPGLFFAGEVCDVDGRLGGYNFQWAWSSGAVAGRAAAKFAARLNEHV